MFWTLIAIGNALRWLLRWLVGLALLLIVVLICIQVFSRYFVGAATPELAEISRLLFIWLTFTGAALLISRNDLITIDFISNSLSPGGRRVLDAIGSLATVFFLVALLIYADTLIDVVSAKKAPATGISYVWFYASLIGFCVLGLFFTVERIVSSRFFTVAPAGRTSVRAGEESP